MCPALPEKLKWDKALSHRWLKCWLKDKGYGQAEYTILTREPIFEIADMKSIANVNSYQRYDVRYEIAVKTDMYDSVTDDRDSSPAGGIMQIFE